MSVAAMECRQALAEIRAELRYLIALFETNPELFEDEVESVK